MFVFERKTNSVVIYKKLIEPIVLVNNTKDNLTGIFHSDEMLKNRFSFVSVFALASKRLFAWSIIIVVIITWTREKRKLPN